MEGNPVLGFRYDPTSGAPTIKDSKRVWPRIAETMKREDRLTPNASLVGGYSYPSTYPHTPRWNSKISVGSDAEYNLEFKNECRRKGNQKADTIISGASSQRWKGTIPLQFKNITIADLIQYTSEAGGIYQEKLRITDIAHNFQKSGGFTTLTVEADAKELEV